MDFLTKDLMTIVGVAHGAGVESVSRLVANSFVAGLWQGVVLAAGVAVCLRLLPKTTAAARFAIWTSVFAVLAIVPLLHAFTLRADSVHGGMAGRAMLGHSAMLQVDVRWSFAIAALWLTVSVVRAAKLVMSAVGLRGIWKRAVPVEGSKELLSAAGVRGVELCTSRDVDRPSVIGFFSPRILIPEELFERLTTAEFGQIVLHEVGHLRRADDWINLLQKLSLVVVPLNPVLIWIERRLCLERELACDDDVLRLTRAPKAYATCLTNLAEHRLGRRAAALTLGAWERRSELAQRVHSILEGGLERREGMGRNQARVAMCGLMLALVGGAAGLSRCPQFVSFSRAASPVSAEVRSPAEGRFINAVYEAVSFSASSAQGGAHETLLKASMPVNAGALNSRAANSRAANSRAAHAPAVTRSRQVGARARQARRLLVLSSWEEQIRPRMVFAVSEKSLAAQESAEFRGRLIFTSYAAVPVAGGWLVIQL